MIFFSKVTNNGVKVICFSRFSLDSFFVKIRDGKWKWVDFEQCAVRWF